MIDMKAHELSINIMEYFENFLEDKKIDIPNPEKDEAIECGENPSNIYGTDYGNLMDQIESLISARDEAIDRRDEGIRRAPKTQYDWEKDGEWVAVSGKYNFKTGEPISEKLIFVKRED